MLGPGQPPAGAEGLRHLGLGAQDGGHDLEAPGDEGRAVLVGQGQGLLRGQRVAPAGGVVGHVAAGGLVEEPLPDVALGGAGAPGQLGRGEGAGPGQGLVEAQPVADHDQRGAGRRPPVGQHPPQERLQLRLVDPLRCWLVGLPNAFRSCPLRGWDWGGASRHRLPPAVAVAGSVGHGRCGLFAVPARLPRPNPRRDHSPARVPAASDRLVLRPDAVESGADRLAGRPPRAVRPPRPAAPRALRPGARTPLRR